ncbi:MAG TPA: class 1 fructose-bisphosphatase [Myxococcales bacterium]|nr:class 1 fructose-bisphosphatase [Myxococcales bacterium]HAN30814.1 class 1 fructose-bisphosphatase [Myxococcales bacterium]
MAELLTLSRHILQSSQGHEGATGDFNLLMSHIATATKVVSRQVAKAGLLNVVGKTGETNVQGEEVTKLDIIANETLKIMLDDLPVVCALASEEDESFVPTRAGRTEGRYLIAFDPLDGSSNIDVNVSIGTIFSVRRRVKVGVPATEQDFLGPGSEIVAAGYAVYGSSTMFVYTTGSGVDGFTLDPGVGEYVLSHPNMVQPDRCKVLSMNHVHRARWFAPTRAFADHILARDEERYVHTTGRYIGSLVADFHRNLIYGGLFAYPADKTCPEGKLRLLFEAQPLAMLIEEAGGAASDGRQRILDIEPEGLHARATLVIGNKHEVELYEHYERTHEQ